MACGAISPSKHCCLIGIPAHLVSPPAPAAKIVEQYPYLGETGVIDVLLPKKQDLTLIKL